MPWQRMSETVVFTKVEWYSALACVVEDALMGDLGIKISGKDDCTGIVIWLRHYRNMIHHDIEQSKETVETRPHLH